MAFLIAPALRAGTVTRSVVSGATVAQIKTLMSDAVTAGNTDVILQFAKGGTWGATSSGGDITLDIPAGVTKLTITSDPATSGATPLLCLNTLTFADGLMTDGIVFDGVKLYTGTINRYLVQPSSVATKIPAKVTIRNCWVEGYRAVLYSALATSTSDFVCYNNYFKNIAAGGVINVNTGSISRINIRNNTFNNVGGVASGTAASDYFIDFRSTNSVTSQIVFSNNTIYYPTTQGRGLFRLSGAFTTGYIKENNNLYATGNSTGYAFSALYTNVTAATTDADSVNYYSSVFSSINNTGSMLFTKYNESNPSVLFVNPAADNFTINDPGFTAKTIVGNSNCFYPPTITISGGNIINLDYNFNAGPSASKSFTINTAALKNSVVVTAPQEYEISEDNSTFSNSITVGGSANNLTNKEIYVRLKSGLSIAKYDNTISVATVGGVTKTVSVSGSVTMSLPVLSAATGLTISNVTYTGFHAKWDSVSHAVSYTLRVYQNGTAISTVPSIAANTYDVTGLTPGGNYTFAIVAVGDGVNYNSSTESLPSSSISTPFIYLMTSVNNPNAGTITKSINTPTYSSGASVQLTAAKNFGYKFVNWVDSITGNVLSVNNPYTVTMNETKHIQAVYSVVNTFNFTVTIAGSQWGKVTLTPAPTSGKYEEGTVVSMSVAPNAATTFLYWENNTTATNRTITVDGDKSFTANFDEKSFIVGWDFKNADPKTARTADFYAESTNKGLFDLFEQNGAAATWLSHTGAFSPVTPCAYKWTAGASFATNQRYFQSSFSTLGFQNIQVKSQMAGSYQYYATQKLQASLDGTSYSDVATVPISTSTWTDLNATLSSAYNNQTKIYLRWVADLTSTRNGNTTDNDGTAITNVTIYADKIPVPDSIPPVLISSVPAEAANSVTANGNIVFTFDEVVKAGAGTSNLNSTSLTPLFGSKTVSFAFTKLSYNTDYTFTVPAGAITDKAGNAYAGITLHFRTMSRPVPASRVFDAVIAKDGSGDYTSVQAAVDAAPTGRTQPWLLFVKNGTYNGHVDIPANKPYLNLIGQSRDSVIISDARLSGGSSQYPDSAVYSVDPGATVVVKSANCYFENICFENRFGYNNLVGPQALALYTQNDRTILNNCWLRSYQDTYLTTYGNVSYRHYLKNCRIEGAVDYIYGGGDVFFDHCTLYCNRSSGGYIVAPSHQTGTAWGYVFSNCTIDGPNASYITYLGRPWTNSPKASFLNTSCKIGIYPAGWLEHMGAIPAIFADYNSVDANGYPLDLTSRIDQYWIGDTNNKTWGTAKKSFTDTEAAQYNYENVTVGSDAWDPRAIIEPTDVPASVIVSSNGTVSWDATSYAICYIVLKNNKVVGFTTANSYSDVSFNAQAVYKVIAVAESGALSSAATAVASVITSSIDPMKQKTYVSVAKNQITVHQLEVGAKVSVYSLTGKLLFHGVAGSNTLVLPYDGICVVKVQSDRETVTLKAIQ